ncbi:HAMP domain-containing sensor histidine kinase [Nitrosarchaeum sp.]|uniref:sensor histidine kinase n=1 Tax=Nitrosarchaeum sp. TaxID=2026886 RepID=UPI00247BB62C|nr:HAMP domain-containing sensor histidine kinase [Nitrosarchaeum sp.]MCV0411572.1 HAMP domain-containing histidine kinase [Nitrosarchaeum sp.]
MIPIKYILFLVSGVSSFIIFYMGLVNYITAVDGTTGIILLVFATAVSAGTLLSTTYISKSITKPIEKLAQNMTEFSKTNKIIDKKPFNTNIKEIYELIMNFESMGKKVEETISMQNEYVEKLKNIDKKKVEFSSMISHELKTPLVPILGYVQMLQKQDLMGPLNNQQLDAINEIYSSALKLQKLVGDILTTQKLDLGKLVFNQEDIQISEFLDLIIKDFTPITNLKKISLLKEYDGDAIIFSDRDRINQVFSNLIKNSIDFVVPEKGEIVIGAKPDNDFMQFFVKDNGVGISKDNQKEIFKKFYQIDTSTSRKRDGSGLGLAICKGIVEGLGGKIWVESEENVGTTFYFTIPN